MPHIQSVEKRAGFSLIEVLVVMAIIGLMASLIAVNLTRSNRLSRDARRKNDIAELRKAIKLYFEANRRFPANTDDDGGGWDDSSDGVFLQPLVEGGFIKTAVFDPRNTGEFRYSYQLFEENTTSCGTEFYILGARSFEEEEKVFANANCPGGLDWDIMFDYLIQESI